MTTEVESCVCCGHQKPVRGWCSNCGGLAPIYTEDEMPNLISDPNWQEKCDRAIDAPAPKFQGHPEFLAILEEIRTTHISKGHDYGTNQDTFANVRASQEFGIPAWQGVAIRMNDKMQRIKSFCVKGSLKHESIEDAFLDLANYAAIGLVLYREAKDK